MTWKNLSHALWALAAQFVVGALTGNWWAGAAFGIGLFFGREHAQAEYRWIERFGSHRRAYMPWWGGFDYRVWDVHSWWWNLLLPTLLALLVAGVDMSGSKWMMA